MILTDMDPSKSNKQSSPNLLLQRKDALKAIGQNLEEDFQFDSLL
jgi:hypothetical protein